MLRCDSARMSTRVIAPFGKITWLVSRTLPRPSATAAAVSEVSRATSVTGDDGVSLASTAYKSFAELAPWRGVEGGSSLLGQATFGDSASAGRRSASPLAASMPGMMCEDTVRSAISRMQEANRRGAAWTDELRRAGGRGAAWTEEP